MKNIRVIATVVSCALAVLATHALGGEPEPAQAPKSGTSAPVGGLSEVSVNGTRARLKGSLAER